MREFAVLALLFMSAVSALAQPDTLWSRMYGGTGSDACTVAVPTDDGGFVLAGSRNLWLSQFLLCTNIELVKTNSNGDTIWTRVYTQDSLNMCGSVQQAPDGGYFLAGININPENGLQRPWIARTDAAGYMMSQRTYDNPTARGNGGAGILPPPDTGFMLSGRAYDSSDNCHLWMTVTDTAGNMIWTNPSVGNGSCGAIDILRTADRGFVVVGYAGQFMYQDNCDLWIERLDSTGNYLWDRTFGRPFIDYALNVVQTTDGGFAVAGYAGRADDDESDFLLVRLNSNGDTLWTRTFDQEASDNCTGFLAMPDGGFLLAGTTIVSPMPPDSGGMGVLLVRTDANGNELWRSVTHTTWINSATSICATPDGGFVVGGSCDAHGDNGSDFCLIRFAPELSAPAPHVPRTYVTVSAYPNPFNPSTTISFSIPQSEQVSLGVYDVQGRLVRTLVDGRLSRGTHFVPFDGSRLSSGVYFVRLQAIHNAQTTRVILAR